VKGTEFDVVVIGSGPAGYVAAIYASQQGLTAAVVEKDTRFGGTCLLRGCIPTKALLQSAHLLDKMKAAKTFGITARGVALDYPGVAKFKNRVVAGNAKGIEFLFKKNKVRSIRGWGSLAGRGQVLVTDDDGKSTTLTARRGIILATGSACRHLPFIEMDGKRTIDSDELLDIEAVPKSLIVLGAGAVGTEFASIFASFGSKVTLVELLPLVLPIEDEEVSEALAKALVRKGIAVHTSTQVAEVRLVDGGVEVAANGPDGKALELGAEKLLVATGRRPLTDNIGLEDSAAVVLKGGFVEVDGLMQTGEPGLYAIGDIVPTPMLAHVGSHEGILAVDHIRGASPHPINYDRIPSVTYCNPEVASVGLTEKAAKSRGYDVKIGTFPFSANGKAKIIGEPTGFVKIVGESQHDEVLGVHIIGPKATELITEAVVALNLETTAEELAHSIHPHPTLSEAVGEAAHALFFGQPIHM
jgi:dihydrolipoamide dehydrogenase